MKLLVFPLIAHPFMNTDYLYAWDVVEQQKRVDFMERMYQCSGRAVAGHPMEGLYTGLWQDFCIREAGLAMRERYFEMLEAIQLYNDNLLQPA